MRKPIITQNIKKVQSLKSKKQKIAGSGNKLG